MLCRKSFVFNIIKRKCGIYPDNPERSGKRLKGLEVLKKGKSGRFKSMPAERVLGAVAA